MFKKASIHLDRNHSRDTYSCNMYNSKFHVWSMDSVHRYTGHDSQHGRYITMRSDLCVRDYPLYDSLLSELLL